MFIENGYRNVSLAAIAREAHVAVRTIYVKFGGKAGLLNAVLQSQRDAVFADMPPMTPDGRSLDDVLFEFARRYLQLLTGPRALSLLRMVMAESMNDPQLCAGFIEAGPERTRRMLAAFFGQAHVREQLLPGCTPDQLAADLTACLLGDRMPELLLTGHLPQRPVPDREIRDTVTLFLMGRRIH